MTYLWVAVGSALGGAARYWFAGVAARLLGEAFPWGTVFVNVTGSFVIGFIAALAEAEGRLLLPSDARAFLMAGFCGGFTTFSAFSIQTLTLARGGEWLWAGANVVVSVVLCLLAVWGGHAAAAALSR